MALEAAAGQPASSSSVTPTDKLHSTLRDDLVTKASLSCLLRQESSEAPGTFLTAPSSRQNRLQGEGNPGMVLSSRVQNVRAQKHPALLCSPQLVPAHPAGKAEGCSIVRKVPDIQKLLYSPWATSAPGRPSPSEHRSKEASGLLNTGKETVTFTQTSLDEQLVLHSSALTLPSMAKKRILLLKLAFLPGKLPSSSHTAQLELRDKSALHTQGSLEPWPKAQLLDRAGNLDPKGKNCWAG